MSQLSEREAQALDFIRAHSARHGRSPYVHEIADHLGSTSRGFVWRMIDSMARKGVISRIPYVPGSITIPEVSASPIGVTLRSEVRASLEQIAKAEEVNIETLIAEWVSERVIFELRAKARAA